MKNQELAETLHPLERAVLPLVAIHPDFHSIVDKSTLQEIEVMRALQWLQNKKLIVLHEETVEIVKLDTNGKKYQERGLPERNFLKQIHKEFMPVERIKAAAAVLPEELNICLGSLKKKAAIELQKQNNILMIRLTEAGKRLQECPSLEEQFLQTLTPSRKMVELGQEEVFAIQQLKPRHQIIKTDIIKQRTVTLTHLGKEISQLNIAKDVVDRLTSNHIKTKSWKGKEFRRYDVEINVPKSFGGRRQPYTQFLRDIRLKLAQMGFAEEGGPAIETEFFNFDALYQPQNHPARTWTDTYRLKYPTHGDLPEKRIVDAIKKAHEDGGNTGSKGWGYSWSEEIAKKLMPRAHGTAITARQASRNPDTPFKFFSIVRVYRPDVLDATHLIEFNHLEGFVGDESITFKSLLGLLKEFAIEITGAEEVKFFPDYYPFTEPSVQMSAKHPQLGWIELGGAGIFRPEFVGSLGIDVPTIGWSIGIDRLAMYKLGVKDIRYLFSDKLDWLRSCKVML